MYERVLTAVWVCSLTWLTLMYGLSGENDSLMRLARAHDQIAGAFKAYLCVLFPGIFMTVDAMLLQRKRKWTKGLYAVTFVGAGLLPTFAFTDEPWVLCAAGFFIVAILLHFDPDPLLMMVVVAFSVPVGLYEAGKIRTGMELELVFVGLIHWLALQLVGDKVPGLRAIDAVLTI